MKSSLSKHQRMQVRVSVAEAETFVAAAAKDGMTLSVWVRQQLRKAAPVEEGRPSTEQGAKKKPEEMTEAEKALAGYVIGGTE